MTSWSNMFILAVFGIFTTIDLTVTQCASVNVGVNCSFDTSAGCLKHYERYDKHGLKWQHGVGAIKFNIKTNTYNNGQQHRAKQILARSPNNCYMYIRGSSDPRVVNLWTDLVSPSFTTSGNGCLYFMFHNNVCGDEYDPYLKSFEVTLQEQTKGSLVNTSIISLRDYPCINSTSWYNEKIPITVPPGTYNIVFSTRHHGNTNQTVAVDHVIYTDQSCAMQFDHVPDTGDCEFDNNKICGYRTLANQNNQLHWKPIRREMMNRGNGGIQAPEGWFLLLWGTPNISADADKVHVHVRSPKLKMKSDGCLSVTYYSGRHDTENGGRSVLSVSQTKVANNTNTTLYNFPSTLGENWLKAFIPLPKGRYGIRFSASIVLPYGDSPHDVTGLDDIEIHHQSCDVIKCQQEFCETSSATPCKSNGHRKCVGRQLKQGTCICSSVYYGQYCQHNNF